MKRIINLSLMGIFVLCLVGAAKAQYGIIKLGDGTSIVVRTKITPSASKSSLGNIYSSNSGNIVHRILTDKKNKIYFGYDLVFEKESDGKFRVSIKPLSKTPDAIMSRTKITALNQEMERARAKARGSNRVSVSRSGTASRRFGSDFSDYTEKALPNYPEDFVVNDGDTISLDILENAKNNTKITDLIKISSKSEGFNYYSFNDDKPARDFTLDDVIFRMEQPKVYINDKEYKTNTTVAGNVSWIYIKGKGRFIFSIKPQPGFNFQQIGTIRNNKFSFEFNGEKYRFVSKSPIVGMGGNWNLWVMHDSDYQTSYELSEENPFAFGAVGRVENLFNRR